MKQYIALLEKVMKDGISRSNRTGIDTLSLFGETLKIDLSDGFPLLTTKKLYFKGIIGELVWFLHGETNIGFLNNNNIHIWDNWADANGELGPIYGKQWRNWDGIDQIKNILDQLTNDPFSRRIILSAWNVSELSQMALPPCHIMAQFYVNGKTLDCAVYQRSADIFLGLPFDIASYAALVFLLAHIANLEPGKLTYFLGDIHLYKNHIEAAKMQLKRIPRKLPNLHISGNVDIDNISIADFTLTGYNPQPAIKGEVAI